MLDKNHVKIPGTSFELRDLPTGVGAPILCHPRLRRAIALAGLAAYYNDINAASELLQRPAKVADALGIAGLRAPILDWIGVDRGVYPYGLVQRCRDRVALYCTRQTNAERVRREL